MLNVRLFTHAALSAEDAQRSPSHVQLRNKNARDARNSVAMASIDNEMAFQEERVRWRMSQTSTTNRNSTGRPLSKEIGRQSPRARRSSAQVSPRAHLAGTHPTRQAVMTTHTQRLARSKSIHASPMRNSFLFSAMEAASPIPPRTRSPENSTLAPMPTPSMYMAPEPDPEPVPTGVCDPFVDAILFDEPYAHRRRRVQRNADEPSIAFHLPTGARDIVGHRGV